MSGEGGDTGAAGADLVQATTAEGAVGHVEPALAEGGVCVTTGAPVEADVFFTGVGFGGVAPLQVAVGGGEAIEPAEAIVAVPCLRSSWHVTPSDGRDELTGSRAAGRVQARRALRRGSEFAGGGVTAAGGVIAVLSWLHNAVATSRGHHRVADALDGINVIADLPRVVPREFVLLVNDAIVAHDPPRVQRVIGPKIMPNLVGHRHERRLILQARPTRAHEIRAARRADISQPHSPRGRVAIGKQMPKSIPPGGGQPRPPPPEIRESSLIITIISRRPRNRTPPLLPIPSRELRRVPRLLIPGLPSCGGLHQGLGKGNKNVAHIRIEEIDDVQLSLNVVVHPTNSSSRVCGSGPEASQPLGKTSVDRHAHCCSIRRGRTTLHQPVGRQGPGQGINEDRGKGLQLPSLLPLPPLGGVGVRAVPDGEGEGAAAAAAAGHGWGHLRQALPWGRVEKVRPQPLSQ